MKMEILISIIVSFFISALVGPFVIPYLKRLKVGQTVREEGPKSHLKKTGTPVMGGFIFLISIIITCLFYVKQNPVIVPILLVTLGFGAIGFADDYIKVVLKRSMGLRVWQKMSAQIVVTTAFVIYLEFFSKIDLTMRVPFLTDTYLNMGILTIPLLYFVILGTVNGSNFTDGLDGLESCVTITIAAFLLVVAMLTASPVAPITGAVIGALLGFLLYNVHPAKVFMGDTGSLALGGFVAATAIVLQLPIFILLFGFIYLLEILSVIIQVTYFKKTGGKRIFKMAPIHHHFELCGWSETKVVAVFTIVTILFSLIALMAL